MFSCAFAHLYVLMGRLEVFLSHYIVLRHGLSLNFEHTDLTWLAGQWTQSFSCLCLPVSWLQQLPAMFNILHRCWGSELRLLCSSIQHFIHQGILAPRTPFFKKGIINLSWIFLPSFLPFSFVVLEIEYKSSFMLGKYYGTEVYSKTFIWFLFCYGNFTKLLWPLIPFHPA